MATAKKQLAFIGRNVGDVAGSYRIRQLRLEITVQQVLANRKVMLAIGRRLEFSFRRRPSRVVFHHLTDPLLPGSSATRSQFALHSWPAVGAPHFVMERPDVRQRRHVGHAPTED